MYSSLHSTFLSSIDHSNEPTIFCLVYNHLEYTDEKHDELLGSYIESILMHSRTTEDTSTSNIIEIKLVGVIFSSHLSQDEHENYLSTATVVENCEMTCRRVHERLLNEQLKRTSEHETENKLFKSESLKRLDYLLKRKVNFNENVLLFDFGIRKESAVNLINQLELITIKFNRIVPLGLKNMLKDHLNKQRGNKNDSSAEVDKSEKEGRSLSLRI